MPSLEEQLERSVSILEKHHLSYAIAGGMAASVYRDEPRLTKDVDFVISGEGDLVELSKKMLAELGLKAHPMRKADLDGGPLFAIKRKNTAVMVLLGRDENKIDPGVDFLLPENAWVPRALERAEQNVLDWGFKKLPTLTVEDVIIAKLIASKNKDREQDILDLRGIFKAKHDLDFTYIIARMKEFRLTLPSSVLEHSPLELTRASKRIARQRKKPKERAAPAR